MAFDGITIAAMVSELNKNLSGGRINKIAQPESDELLITGKGANGQKRLLLSASASLPLIYFTGKNRISPLTAPNFCMLLRKHIGSARITAIRQPGLERVVEFELEHLNELGDVCHKVLIMELMGKHSNIIFCDDNNMILISSPTLRTSWILLPFPERISWKKYVADPMLSPKLSIRRLPVSAR